MAITKLSTRGIKDAAVTTAKVADSAVTTGKIGVDVIVAEDVAANAITVSELAANAVTTVKIANGAVTADKIASGAIPSGVNIASSTPSPTAEGTLHYNTTLDILYVSNGSAWLAVTNTPPATTGGTVTITTLAGLTGTFNYNLGINFTDDTQADGDLAYTLESGTLPAGAVLPTQGNSTITGTATNPSANTTYNFVIRATDGSAAFSTQAYTQVITKTVALSSGGTLTTPTGFRVHTFTSSGTFNGGNQGQTATIAIVAGGASGGGARHGSGGGAGGMVVLTNQAMSYANQTVTIGAGGASRTGGLPGLPGANTVFGSTTVLGGGRGGCYDVNADAAYRNGGNGGSGGGCGYDSNPGLGTSGQGNNGGDDSTTASGYGGGGGGGKSAVGGAGSGTAGGNGGAGLAFNGVTYAGGGAGPAWQGTTGTGGAGGGGNGGPNQQTNQGVGGAGTTNTGGGGGGANAQNNNAIGGAGGSGIVVIKITL